MLYIYNTSFLYSGRRHEQIGSFCFRFIKRRMVLFSLHFLYWVVVIMGFVEKWIESLDYQFEISSSVCIRHKSPKSTCVDCFTVCPEDAIALIDGKPMIDLQKCSECGACLTACPVQAVSGILPKQCFFHNKLIAAKDEPPSIQELLIYYAKGITAIACKDKDFPLAWKEKINEVNTILAQLGKAVFVTETESNFEDSFSRRELFTLWKKEGQSLVKQVTPAKWRFNHTDLKVNQYYPDHQFYDVAIDTEKCTLCRVCKILCPTNCFTIEDNQFAIDPQACTGCQLCRETCPENAITVTDFIAQAYVKYLPAFQKTCGICKDSFQTLHKEDEKCPICASRKTGYLSSTTY